MKILLVLFLSALIILFYLLGGRDYLSFEFLKMNLNLIQIQYENQPFEVIMFFLASYLALTSLSIPGSIILTILAGALFGTTLGVTLVTIAGTMGAALSFLMSRYLFQDYLNQKFFKQFHRINTHLKHEGIFSIFALRFIPVSPFVVINLVLGLTKLPLWTFIWTTAIGMLPGNILYVYAGKKIAEIDSPGEIMTPAFIICLTVLGLLPLVMRKIINWRRHRLIHA